MGVVKTATGGYAVGLELMGLVALACLLVPTGLKDPGGASRPVARAPTAAGELE